jgi:hypothetical protein
MPRTPYLEGESGFSSMLIFMILAFGPNSLAISSKDGPIILQGPHHSAQKSTTTGVVELITSASKLASVTLWVDMSFLQIGSVTEVVTNGGKVKTSEPS